MSEFGRQRVGRDHGAEEEEPGHRQSPRGRHEAPQKGVQDPPLRYYLFLLLIVQLMIAVLRGAGSGESGKSTIVKQMKIIHQNGYSVEELSMYRLTVYKNLLDCAKSLVWAMHQFEIQPSSAKVRDFMDYLLDYNIDPDPNVALELKVGDAITYLWNDPSIPAVLERQNEFYLMDSAPYYMLIADSFFEEAKRITMPDYIPNEADVLRARTKTTGIYETRFTMGQLSIQY
ncbi:hypothetical protein TRV_02395, partial [Trichophyton verrucosum HKI 0517]